MGHPYCDVIDNSTDFESKIRRVIEAVCKRLGGRLGVDIDDRLQAQSRKRKFLVKSLPDIKVLVVATGIFCSTVTQLAIHREVASIPTRSSTEVCLVADVSTTVL